MIGEIDYEVIVGVIHNFLAIVFFIMVFAGDFSSPMFIEKRPYGPSLMNMRYMVGNLVCFPTSCWRMVACVTLDTGGGCGECDSGLGVACGLCFWWCSGVCMV